MYPPPVQWPIDPVTQWRSTMSGHCRHYVFDMCVRARRVLRAAVCDWCRIVGTTRSATNASAAHLVTMATRRAAHLMIASPVRVRSRRLRTSATYFRLLIYWFIDCVWACAAKIRWWFGEEMYGVWSWGSKTRGRQTRTWTEVVREDFQARKLNKEDAMDRCKWRKVIKDVWWSGWLWVGECFFWYRLTRVVPDQRPLNGSVCVCVCVWHAYTHVAVNMAVKKAR